MISEEEEALVRIRHDPAVQRGNKIALLLIALSTLAFAIAIIISWLLVTGGLQ